MSADDPQVVPVLTADTPPGERVIGQGPVINGGSPNVRLTNPSLYRNVMLSAAVSLAMGLNFLLGAIPGGLIPSPTFFIYDQSNLVWATGFLILGVGKIGSLIRNRDRIMRLVLWLSFVYLTAIMFGTCQPWREGDGSLQLPILYAAWALLCLHTLIDPLINPWTARRDDGD